MVLSSAPGNPNDCGQGWHADIAKHFGHAPTARKFLSSRASEEPGWHYEKPENFCHGWCMSDMFCNMMVQHDLFMLCVWILVALGSFKAKGAQLEAGIWPVL